MNTSYNSGNYYIELTKEEILDIPKSLTSKLFNEEKQGRTKRNFTLTRKKYTRDKNKLKEYLDQTTCTINQRDYQSLISKGQITLENITIVEVSK